MSYCPNCGTKIDSVDTKFCANCGAELIPQEQSSQSKPPILEKVKRKDRIETFCTNATLGLRKYLLQSPSRVVFLLLGILLLPIINFFIEFGNKSAAEGILLLLINIFGSVILFMLAIRKIKARTIVLVYFAPTLPFLFTIPFFVYAALRWNRIGKVFRNIMFIPLGYIFAYGIFVTIMIIAAIFSGVSPSILYEVATKEKHILTLLVYAESYFVSLAIAIVFNGLISMQTRKNASNKNP